jgi:hypothetical protein
MINSGVLGKQSQDPCVQVTLAVPFARVSDHLSWLGSPVWLQGRVQKLGPVTPEEG